MSRRFPITGALGGGLILLLTACTSAAPTESPAPSEAVGDLRPVTSVAVVGDSISVGMSACGTRDACPSASWAFGDDTAVDSIVQRIAAATGTDEITPLSLARPGARVADRVDAVQNARGQTADLVLVEVGSNDVCASDVSQITPVGEFGASYRELLETIRAGVPEAPIVAYSIPDLLQLWEGGRSDPATVRLWNQSPSCSTLLGDADSDAAADVQRREDVVDTLAGYNAAIVEACAAVTGCVSDDGAVSQVAFSPDDISEVDRFHPSLAGQAALAAAAWPAAQKALTE
ncbi:MULTISPECIES: SGNH/GDSL hydrolase family protein [Microbacterium]|uniref:SGNH/GDSL hydrolase family protein n=1 Tax=Microbacterium TaxID=33882 RepID=UPI0027872AF5|nr:MULTISPECIES: SGNH/GDSL hydrolase family protein [Microbacterium]MDQ1084630.1 lysophospholipase L1-like esterase [Microbacterium sp. SORGH_AS_0344]MDQ1170093.1 lysophospholipase L1-like esterase [Microbacterium proteolyticum]